MRKKIVCGIVSIALASQLLISGGASATAPPSASATAPSAPSTGEFEMITLNIANKNVLMLQKRLIDLDYFSFKCTGSYGAMTRTSVIRFQELNTLAADGMVGEETFNLLFSNKAVRCPIAASVHMPIGPSSQEAKAPFGKLADWKDEVDPIFKPGNSYAITDLNTGVTYQVVRTGGVNHARIETANVLDTEAMLNTFGEEFNWSKRPVTVTIDGITYAASLQGMPSGEDGRDGNEMMGGCALYFSGSRSDIGNIADEEHRLNVLRASGENW